MEHPPGIEGRERVPDIVGRLVLIDLAHKDRAIPFRGPWPERAQGRKPNIPLVERDAQLAIAGCILSPGVQRGAEIDPGISGRKKAPDDVASDRLQPAVPSVDVLRNLLGLLGVRRLGHPRRDSSHLVGLHLHQHLLAV